MNESKLISLQQLFVRFYVYSCNRF